MEKQLLTDVLNSFARYMREEGDKLTPQEVNEISVILRQLCKVAVQLSKGKRFSTENRIDTSSYINGLLKKTRGEKEIAPPPLHHRAQLQSLKRKRGTSDRSSFLFKFRTVRHEIYIFVINMRPVFQKNAT